MADWDVLEIVTNFILKFVERPYQKKECFKLDCTYKHHPNTKRKKDKVVKLTVVENKPKEKKAKENKNKTGSKQNSSTPLNEDPTFLELKKEILKQVFQGLMVLVMENTFLLRIKLKCNPR